MSRIFILFGNVLFVIAYQEIKKKTVFSIFDLKNLFFNPRPFLVLLYVNLYIDLYVFCQCFPSWLRFRELKNLLTVCQCDRCYCRIIPASRLEHISLPISWPGISIPWPGISIPCPGIFILSLTPAQRTSTRKELQVLQPSQREVWKSKFINCSTF